MQAELNFPSDSLQEGTIYFLKGYALLLGGDDMGGERWWNTCTRQKLSASRVKGEGGGGGWGVHALKQSGRFLCLVRGGKQSNRGGQITASVIDIRPADCVIQRR